MPSDQSSSASPSVSRLVTDLVGLPCLTTFGRLASAGRLVSGLHLVGRYQVSWHVQTSSVDSPLTCASSDVTGVVPPRPCPSIPLSRMHRLCPAGDARPSPRQPSVCRRRPVIYPSRCLALRVGVTSLSLSLRASGFYGASVSRSVDWGHLVFCPSMSCLVCDAERYVGIRVVHTVYK